MRESVIGPRRCLETHSFFSFFPPFFLRFFPCDLCFLPPPPLTSSPFLPQISLEWTTATVKGTPIDPAQKTSFQTADLKWRTSKPRLAGPLSHNRTFAAPSANQAPDSPLAASNHGNVKRGYFSITGRAAQQNVKEEGTLSSSLSIPYSEIVTPSEPLCVSSDSPHTSSAYDSPRTHSMETAPIGGPTHSSLWPQRWL